MNRKILVAAAWPYANGSLHLGHVAGLLGADIIARYYRLNGDDVMYVSGSDCHGTPIALAAEKEGVTAQEVAEKYHKEFVETLVKGLHFSYDNYTTTMTENHEKVVQDLFLKLHENGYIYTKKEKMAYCDTDKRYLPDRYVEGTCPICGFDNARGDQCDNCGNLLNPIDLKEPKCKICHGTPEWRDTEHFFLKFSPFADQLLERAKTLGDKWRINAKNFTINLLEQGFHDRAITRDTDWGIPIPLPGYEDKRIYVWFEAVSGYLSASIEYSKNIGNEDWWKEFWQNDEAIHYYVHGKDNIPFHTIIWPSILLGYGGLHLPDVIVSSEYLTLEKKQFSKSRNWCITLPDFLSKYDPDTLRYYLVVCGPENADADFSWGEYASKVNSEMIGNFGNLVNRVFSIIKNNFSEGVNAFNDLSSRDQEVLSLASESFKEVGDSIANIHFRDALKAFSVLVDVGNKYINETEPWRLVKTDRAAAEKALSVCAHLIKCLGILCEPFLPVASEKIRAMFNFDSNYWRWAYPEPEQIIVKEVVPIYRRIEEAEVKAEVEKLGGSGYTGFRQGIGNV